MSVNLKLHKVCDSGAVIVNLFNFSDVSFPNLGVKESLGEVYLVWSLAEALTWDCSHGLPVRSMFDCRFVVCYIDTQYQWIAD